MRYRGLTPKEFQGRFDRSFDAGESTSQNLWNPLSATNYRGILLRDHPSLANIGVLYEVWADVNVIESQFKLKAEISYWKISYWKSSY